MTATVVTVELDPTLSEYRGVPIPEGAHGVEVTANSLADCAVRVVNGWTAVRPDFEPQHWQRVMFRPGESPTFPLRWRGIVDKAGALVA